MDKYNKILNDPVYGFITIPYKIIFEITEHPYFQRLRRISQLGLSNFVYPGANHSRFQHVLGAMHLITQAIEVIRSKGFEITSKEAEAVTLAIVLHDIGHGPYSHTLEKTIVKNVHHEYISLLFMKELNRQFSGKLSMAIDIFKNKYKKGVLHQLVSSQLDMDRLDYLKRDSFFTGVSEGVVGLDRIIKMLNVVNGKLAIEKKGIYSVEKFLIARRIMYWQVYLHKTTLSAEILMSKILKRAKDLALQKKIDFSYSNLNLFLINNCTKEDFENDKIWLEAFSKIDDYDVMFAIKTWCNHSDKILSNLCNRIVNRNLFRITLQNKPFKKSEIEYWKNRVKIKLNISKEEVDYFVSSKKISNTAYSDDRMDQIHIFNKDGSLSNLASDVDIINIAALSKPIEKYYLCHPKDI